MNPTSATSHSARGENFYRLGLFTAVFGAALLASYAIYLAVGPQTEPWNTIFKKGVFDTVLFSAAFACFFRAAAKRGDAKIWIAFGIGCLMQGFGVLYHQTIMEWDSTPPYPSPQDAFYLAVYPAWYAGMLMLARRQMRDNRKSHWLHGVIGGLAVAALMAALVFDKIVNTSGDNTAAIVTNLAYPSADTMLVALLVCILAMNGFRTGRVWGMILGGVALFYAGDIIFALQAAAGTFVPGGFLDLTWPAGMLLIAFSGFVGSPKMSQFRNEDRLMVAPAIAFSVIALSIIVYGSTHDVNPAAIWIASAALGVLIVQFTLATLENSKLLRASRHEATFDQVTDLPNRRQLAADVEHACSVATVDEPSILMLFDLNGFKAYNDRFGHLAGDVLLRRLGARLQDSLASSGTVYRLGGDEFCALIRDEAGRAEELTALALDALHDHGEGFETSSSVGVSHIPADSTDPIEIVRIADERMYAQKHGDGSHDARHIDTVIRVIQRFAPMIDTHRTELSPIVRETALKLSVPASEAGTIASAFEVRDVGYYAVPDEVLQKPGPLNDAEWALMRTHPVVGERLLGISPTLRGVAKLVRSSHERMDGNGYPDGLPGKDIPLGARIIAIAAAFDAMVSTRPHRKPMSVDDAIVEIKRGAGTQFDGIVAEKFCEIILDSAFEPHLRPVTSRSEPSVAALN